MHRCSAFSMTAVLPAALSLCGAAASVSAQGLTLRFEPDRTTASPGTIIEWTVFAEFSGYPDPTAYFGGFVGEFLASDPTLAAVIDSESLMSRQAVAPYYLGGDVFSVNVFNAALLGSNDPTNPYPFFRFRADAGVTPGIVSYTAIGEASVFPDDGIFTPVDAYINIFSIESGAVEIVGAPDPRLTIRFIPDRARVYHQDTVTWTARFEFPDLTDPGAFFDFFEGDLSVEGPVVGPLLGPVTGLTSLVGGDVSPGETIGLTQAGIVAGQSAGSPIMGSPIDVFSFQTEAGWGGAASMSASGEVWISVDGSSPSIRYEDFEVVSEPLTIESPYAGPVVEYAQTPDFPGQGDLYGMSVDADGRYAVVGSPIATVGPFQSGAAYIVDLLTGQQVARLLPSNAMDGSWFGRSVAIDGGLIAVSAPLEELDSSSNSGAVYIFDRATGQELQRIENPNGGPGQNFFGLAMDLSDGIVLGGSPSRVTAFDALSGELLYWINRFPDLGSPGLIQAENGEVFVAASSVLETDDDRSRLGTAYDLATGTLRRQFLTDVAIYDPPNSSVSLRASFANGVAAFGVPSDTLIPGERPGSVFEQAGAVYVFDSTNAVLQRRITYQDASISRSFGSQLATDGERLIVGGITSGINDDTVYSDGLIFDLESGWLMGEVPMHNEFWFHDIAFSGDTILVGDFLDDTNGTDAGRLLVIDASAPCSRADLAAPWSVFDLADVLAFVSAYSNQQVAADIAEPYGVFDLADVQAMITGFTAGCP